MRARVDDVIVEKGAATYDDFSTELIDPAKWETLTAVRQVVGGKLVLNVQGAGSRSDISLRPIMQDAGYLKAKLKVRSDSWLSPGASGVARLAGWYYNESRGPGSGMEYNENEGDVWLSNSINIDDNGNLTADCSAYRIDTEDPWGPGTSLFYHQFSTEINFDRYYTLGIALTGSRIVFSCENKRVEYNITTAMYPPSDGQSRQLQSRVYAGEEQAGYMLIDYDDAEAEVSGDVDVDIADAISALQICAGLDVSTSTQQISDFNGDGKIGLTEGICALQMTAGLRPQPVDHGPIRLSIQHGYPENYALAISTFYSFSSVEVTGPDVANVWQASDTHALANLSERPTGGDTYSIGIHYADGAYDHKSYVVDTINDSFAWISYPSDGETINTTTPTFSWSEASNIETYTIIIQEITGDGQDYLWMATFPAGTTSALYNSDGEAEGPLEAGQSYRIYLHTYDGEGNQATTTSTFSIQ
jgi:hypothetical protein